MVDITGDNAANQLFGSLGDDLIKAKGGDDYVNGFDGNDRLKAGGGADVIVDGAGQDRMWGGNGSDTFVLVGDGDKDRIMDWQNGQDLIDLTDWGVTSLADLTFQVKNNGQMKITFGDEELQIKQKGGAALTIADFDASDFVFAPTGARSIDFEDLSIQDPSYGGPIQILRPGYEGFTWSESFYFVEADDLATAGLQSGHLNRTGGGNVFGFAGFGNDVDFSADDNFDFEAVTVGSAYRDGMTLRIIGVDDGQFVGDQLVTIDTTGSTDVHLNDAIFDSVDQVVFQSFGGTSNAAYQNAVGNDTHFYIDDLMVA